MACLEFAVRALTTEQATDRKIELRRCYRAGALCVSAGLFLFFHGSNLLLHLPDEGGQLFFTFLLGRGVDVPGHALSVNGRGVAALPEVVVDLADTAGAGLAALALVGLEGEGGGFLGAVSTSWAASLLAIPRSILAAAVLCISPVTWA